MKSINKYIFGILIGVILIWCLFEPVDEVMGKLVSLGILYAIILLVVLLVFGFSAFKNKDKYMLGYLISSRKYHWIAGVLTLLTLYYIMKQ